MGKESVIVEKIGYDKDGHTVYTKLGNGTETTYAYDKQRERLQSMMLKAGNDSIMENKYSYDAVDNILSIVNSGSGKSNLSGASTHNYTYDMLNRLTSANGSAKDIKYAMSMTFGKMSEPLTKVQTVDSTSVAKSYNLAYKYEDALHPTAPSQIGNEHYTYDANGNPILVENDSTSTTREMFWDEDNRLMVLSDNGKTSRYTYNAGGERIIKSHGSMEGVYINGAPQGITFHETDEFTLYPASILSVSKHRFTKHYFIGDKRVASRIGLGEFNNVYGSNGSNVTAGQRDYAERMNQIENQREDYYKAAGVAPGLPTMKGSYADPEVTGVGYNVLIKELGDHSVPENWVQRPVVNTEAGSTPGAPLAWGSQENPDDAVAGYGYVAADTSEVEETFYYHSDHLGSTSYITDKDANVTQYDAYLPYGELLVDEHSSSEEMPYKFNGKELDEETGLYYYGARYMNPVTSMWYGVDPLAEKYVATGAYVYCHGNPIILFDPDGQGDYYINGNWAYSDNKNDGKVYLSSTNGSVTYRNNRFTEWNYSMKSKTFKGILAKTLKLEGGKVNDKADRGGQTNLGITLDTFKRYAQKLLSIEGTSANLDHLQPCQAAKLYEVAYWEKFGANQIEDAQIAELYYDTAVNGGGNAVLRSTLADFGISNSKNPKSDLNKIVMKYGAEFVFEIFKAERIDRYERIAAENPSQKKFLKGWKNRVNSFKYKTAEFQPQPQSVRSKSLTRELN